MRFLELIIYVIGGPFRFLLINGQLLLATFVLSISISARSGYPWPGFIDYILPGLPMLFLGVLLAVAFLQLKIINAVTGWGRLLCFLLFAVTSSVLLRSLLPPPDSVVGVIAMFVTVAFIWWGYKKPPRDQYLFHCLIFAFVLIVFKFIVLNSAFFKTITSVLGLPLLLLSDTVPTAAGSGTPSTVDEYFVFTGFILYSCALMLQYPYYAAQQDNNNQIAAGTQVGNCQQQITAGTQVGIGKVEIANESLNMAVHPQITDKTQT